MRDGLNHRIFYWEFIADRVQLLLTLWWIIYTIVYVGFENMEARREHFFSVTTISNTHFERERESRDFQIFKN